MTVLGDFDDPTSTGITIIVFICLFVLFNRILKINLGSTVAIGFFGAFVLWFFNQRGQVQQSLNHKLLKAYQDLGSPQGLELDPNLILLFEKLKSIVGDSGFTNVKDAAASASQVLLIHSHFMSISTNTDGTVQFQNARDHATASMDSIHSCALSDGSGSGVIAKLIMNILDEVKDILDDYLSDIHDKINIDFAENIDTVGSFAQFIEPKLV